MKNGATYFKYSTVLIIVLASLWFFRDCNHTGVVNPTKHDTISVLVDTGYIVYQHDTFTVPHPYKIVYHDTLHYFVHDSGRIEYERVDTAALIADYTSTKYYRNVHPSTYGIITVFDTLTYGRLDGEGIHENLSIPVITKTVTLQQSKRNILYFGMGAYTDKSWSLTATSASIAMKFKNDKIVSFNGILFKGGNVGIGGSFYFPIKLHK